MFKAILLVLAASLLAGCNTPEVQLTELSPLHMAAIRGDTETVAAWIKSGKSVNGKFNNYSIGGPWYQENSQGASRNLTALMLASYHGRLQIVQMLVEAGADLYEIESNARRDDLGNAFDQAVQRDHVAVAIFLWESSDRKTFRRDFPGKFAGACARHCRPGENTNPKTNLAFFLLSLMSDEERGVGIGELACLERPLPSAGPPSLGRLKFLRDAGVKFPPNTLQCILGGRYSWDSAAGVEIVKFLLDQGADPNGFTPQWNFPLQMAAQTNDPELMTLLVSRGADPNLKDFRGRTALIWFADTYGGCAMEARYEPLELRYLATIRHLISLGADPRGTGAPLEKQAPHLVDCCRKSGRDAHEQICKAFGLR